VVTTRLDGSAVVCTGDSVGVKVTSTLGALVGAIVAMGALVLGAKLGVAVGGETVGSSVTRTGADVGVAVRGANVGELVMRIVGASVTTATGRNVGADCGLCVAKKGGCVGPVVCGDCQCMCEPNISTAQLYTYTSASNWHSYRVVSLTHTQAHSQSHIEQSTTVQIPKLVALAEIESTYWIYCSFPSWPS
jgi:hypothetical protein